MCSLPSICVMLNHHPHYCTLPIDPASITVTGLLEHASVWMGKRVAPDTSALKLRWIVDESMAFRLPLVGPGPASAWYYAKGRHLASTLIDSDDDLREKLRDRANAQVVQLYVIAPPLLAVYPTAVETARATYRDTLRPAAPEASVPTTAANPRPSKAARDVHVHREAQGIAPMYNGRQPLANNLGPNAAIYHPAFARMLHAFYSDGKLIQVDLDDDVKSILNGLQRELVWLGVENKGQYMDVVEKHFKKLFPGMNFIRKYCIYRKGKRDIVLDFVVTCPTPYGVDAVIVVGSATFWDDDERSCLTEALHGFRRIYLESANQPIFSASSCPCMIISISDMDLQMGAAYFTDAVYSTPMALLSMAYVPGTCQSQEENMARRFQVLRNTVLMLAQSYGETHTGAYDSPNFLLPAPCVVPEAGGAWASFCEFPGFSLEFKDACFTTEGRAIFTGEITLYSTQSPMAASLSHVSTSPSTCNADAIIPSIVPVYVKFVQKYGEEVHKALSEKGLAPELRWCGRVCGGPIMVIMDKVEGRSVQDFLHDQAVSTRDLKGLDDALALLGDRGFVHGDIRPPNVILQPGKLGGENRAYLIDFDFAGKEGEARYPFKLNPCIRWPLPAEDMSYALITHQHDKDMRSWFLESLEPLDGKTRKSLPSPPSTSPDDKEPDVPDVNETMPTDSTSQERPPDPAQTTPMPTAAAQKRRRRDSGSDEAGNPSDDLQVPAPPARTSRPAPKRSKAGSDPSQGNCDEAAEEGQRRWSEAM